MENNKKSKSRRKSKRARNNRRAQQQRDSNAEKQAEIGKNSPNAAANQANTNTKTETPPKTFTKKMLNDSLNEINGDDNQSEPKYYVIAPPSEMPPDYLYTGYGFISPPERRPMKPITRPSSPRITGIVPLTDISGNAAYLCETGESNRSGIFNRPFESDKSDAYKETVISNFAGKFNSQTKRPIPANQDITELIDWMCEEFDDIAASTDFKTESNEPKPSTSKSAVPAENSPAAHTKLSSHFYVNTLQTAAAEAGLSSASDSEYDSDDDYNEGQYIDMPPSNRRNYTQSLRAIPPYAVTDAVSAAGKPLLTMTLVDKIDQTTVTETEISDKDNVILVTQVYTPFQFWFHFVSGCFNTNMVEILCTELNVFYNCKPAVQWQVRRYFLKKDYICVALHRDKWYRVRILEQAVADRIKVFFVDFGYVLRVKAQNLRYMHKQFAHMPAFAMRGCLAHVHQLGLHWHKKDIEYFKSLVLGKELNASMMEVNPRECIYTLQLDPTAELVTTVSQALINAGLAGASEHFSKACMNANHGRRLRYLRERLPTFDMLETGVFPLRNESHFEHEFDDIIYSPEFFRDCKAPPRINPLHTNLYDALDNWLVSYRQEQQLWQQK